MVHSSVLAALQVLVLIVVPSLKNACGPNASGPGSDEVNCAEDVEGLPANGAEAEIDPRSRQSCPEVYEDLKGRLGRRDSDDKILLGVTSKDSEAHELHHHSQAETSCGGENERPTAHMLQDPPEEASQYHGHTSNNPLDQLRDFPTATIGGGALEIAEVNTTINMNSELEGRGMSREQRYREIVAEEEMKRTLKFSYFSTAIASAGIIGIFSGYLGDQMGHAHTIHFKVCTFFMLATFVSGASMLLLTWLHRSCRISIKTFRSLKYTTLGFLTLAMFDVSFLFLKIFAILAIVPALLIVMIASLMALCSNGPLWSYHQDSDILLRMQVPHVSTGSEIHQYLHSLVLV